MSKKQAEKLAIELAKCSNPELHGFGILFAGGWSARLPNAPKTAAERQRPDADSLAAVIAELDSRDYNVKVRGLSLSDRLRVNLATFTRQAKAAIERAKKEKEKATKAKTA
jgi:hypothetical protein